MPTDELRYVVRRFNWRRAGPCFVRAPGEHRVAWFDSPDEADADRWRRELEVRGRINPFHCGPAFHYLSAMPEPVFQDWLLDGGVTPPGLRAGAVPWADWWDEVKAALPADLTARVWEGLDRVRFFGVVARRPAEVAYAVVRVMWDYNDSWYEAGDEGGRTVVAFRTRDRAEARRRELEATARTEGGVGWIDARRWDATGWPEPGSEVGTQIPADQLPYYEVVEIDLGSGA